MYVYTTESRSSSTLENDWPQHGRPAAFVIAQQYSSTTLVLVTALSPWSGKFRCAFLKSYCFNFFNCMKLLKSELA